MPWGSNASRASGCCLGAGCQPGQWVAWGSAGGLCAAWGAGRRRRQLWRLGAHVVRPMPSVAVGPSEGCSSGSGRGRGVGTGQDSPRRSVPHRGRMCRAVARECKSCLRVPVAASWSPHRGWVRAAARPGSGAPVLAIGGQPGVEPGVAVCCQARHTCAGRVTAPAAGCGVGHASADCHHRWWGLCHG